MRTSRRASRALPIVLASLLALSCDNSFGIFAGVQDEIEQKGADIFQKTQVKNAFKLGAKYYAATQTLNARAVNSADWAAIDVGGHSDYRLRSAVLAGTTMYALIETGSVSDPTISVHASSDGSSWTPVATLPSPSLGALQTFSLDTLFAAGSELYAEGHLYDSSSSQSTFTLYHLVGTSLAAEVTNFAPAADKSIRGVVFDGADYWYASEDLLRRGTAADATADASISFTSLSAKEIWAISYTGSFVYISTTDGNLYRSGTAAPVSVASVPLTQVVEVPAATATELLVGTDTGDSTAAGYYEGLFGAMASGEDGAVTKTSSIYNTTVSSFPVQAFYYDSDVAAYRLFVCISPGSSSANLYGLYTSVWDPVAETWSGWQAE